MAIDTTGVSIERDTIFGEVDGQSLLCDIYRPPAGISKHTALIHLHGGGFRGGSKAGARVAAPLAALGYVGVSIDYRLSGDAKWPAQIEDTKAAVRWTRANVGSLDIDASKIAVVGYSAGGHLALIASGSANTPQFEGAGGNPDVSSHVAGCVAFYPVSRLERNPDGSAPDPLAGDSTDATILDASPIHYAAPGFPPTILIHGTADTTIPIGDSFRLYEALNEAGVAVELHAIQGVEHIFDGYPEFAELCATTIDLFLDRHVVNPRPYPGRGPR